MAPAEIGARHPSTTSQAAATSGRFGARIISHFVVDATRAMAYILAIETGEKRNDHSF